MMMIASDRCLLLPAPSVSQPSSNACRKRLSRYGESLLDLVEEQDGIRILPEPLSQNAATLRADNAAGVPPFSIETVHPGTFMSMRTIFAHRRTSFPQLPWRAPSSHP